MSTKHLGGMWWIEMLAKYGRYAAGDRRVARRFARKTGRRFKPVDHTHPNCWWIGRGRRYVIEAPK